MYLHFPSKEEAVLSHVDRIVERLCGRMDTIAAGAGPALSADATYSLMLDEDDTTTT